MQNYFLIQKTAVQIHTAAFDYLFLNIDIIS